MARPRKWARTSIRDRKMWDVIERYKRFVPKYRIARELQAHTRVIDSLLIEAQERGFLRIEVSPPELYALAKQLEREFPDVTVYIVPPHPERNPLHRRRLGRFAAEFLNGLLVEQARRAGGPARVALSGGHLIREMVRALPAEAGRAILYPIGLIGRGPTVMHADPFALMSLWWARAGGPPEAAFYATVPPYDPAEFEAASVEQTIARIQAWNESVRSRYPIVQQVFAAMENIDIAILGVGAVPPDPRETNSQHSTLTLANELHVSTEWLQHNGYVGDIGYSFIKEDGRAESALNLFITHGANLLARMVRNKRAQHTEQRVVVLAGQFKVKVVRAILEGGLCTDLFTDADTAKALLDETGKKTGAGTRRRPAP